MPAKKIDFKKLSEPFPYDEIQWRLQSCINRNGQLIGMALAYYDARLLYERLDKVCGVENWQIRYPHANAKTCAEIGILINGEWVWKANGAGDTQVEAEKGAFSDSAKRAGVPWGIGRYLYEFKNTWVECEKRGKSNVIKKDQYSKLEKAYSGFLKNGNFDYTPPEEPQKTDNGVNPVNQDEFEMMKAAIEGAGTMDDLSRAWANVSTAYKAKRLDRKVYDGLSKLKDGAKQIIEAAPQQQSQQGATVQ
ncbi:MAG: Rad52/Rad22 family DNA repair protein [Alphaproteobacteria bacterium]